MNNNEDKFIFEEGIKIPKYQNKTKKNIDFSKNHPEVSKDLEVFYNPVMKTNRDISLLVIKSHFDKKIKFCDPMVASGIREIRFLKTIPEMFDKLTLGDISQRAIDNVKSNFELNDLNTDKLELMRENAINTTSSGYFDFIEIDPFGSPVPFLDIACQRIKHKGILSVTATDTAALCGTYPKTGLRRYGIKMEKPLWHEEFGLRNLIAYCQRQAAKYDKYAKVLLSYSDTHYFKIFFVIEESRGKATQVIKDLSYIEIDKKTQEISLNKYETENTLGKTYIGSLNDKEFLEKVISNMELIENKKKIDKLLNKLNDEIDVVGHYNPHKLEKSFKYSSDIRFDDLVEKLKEKGYRASRPHNNRLGIKTDAPAEVIIDIMKNKN